MGCTVRRGCVVVFAMLLLVVSVLSTATAAGAADPVLTDSARSVVAGAIAGSQVAQPSSATARDARVRSRTAFRGLSPAEARQTLLARHPSLASQPGWLTFPSLSPLSDLEPLGPYLLSVDGGVRADSVVLTSEPIAFRDSAGDLRKIDLGLERDGSDDLVTRSSPSDLSVPDALDQGISVGDGDRRFSVLPDVSNGASEAAVEQYAAFYGDVDPDTDFVVKPVPGGVETFSILRSPASPEEMRLRLSGDAGSELRPMDGGDGFVFSQGDEDLAAITPPQAWDAQHRPVDVETSIDGDELVMRVDHRDRDVAYPIVVDPTVVDTCWAWVDLSSGCQVDAWETDTSGRYNSGTAGWGYFAPDGRFSQYAGPGYLGTGLYIRNLVQNYFTQNEAGYWAYTAPAGVRIWSALLSNLSQDNLSDNTTCLFVGVLENTGAWGRNSPGINCAQQVLDTSFLWCPGTSCSDQSGGTPGNTAIFGAMARRTGWSSYWMDHMGGAALALTEMNWASNVPYISSPDFPDTWQTDPNRWITFHIGDAGLGIRRIDFSSPENSSWQAIDADTGGTASKLYSCTGGTRLACPMDVWIRMKIGRLREGYSTIRVKVTDIVGKTYTYEHPIAIQGGGSTDTFPPSLNLSGPAVDNASRLDTGAWDLEAAATDGAGIATITTVIDGATDDAQTFNSCASCSVNAEFTIDTEGLAAGAHSIRVIAADRLGNQTTKTLTASVSRTAAMNSMSTLDAAMSTDYSEPPACAGAPPFTPYYAGATIAGFRLTYSVSSCEPSVEPGDPGAHSVSYGYGTCDSTVDSCGTPVTITSRPLCEAHAKLYRDENGTELPHTSPTLKGVPAASYNDATTTDLYTGTTAISINSATAATTTAIVNAIRRAPASDIPADGLPLLSWPSAAGTTAATSLDAPNTTMLNATEVRC
jgi:hypothetical protein